jgi:hypothetical protein
MKNPPPPRDGKALRLKKLTDRLKKKQQIEEREATLEAASRVLKHTPPPNRK